MHKKRFFDHDFIEKKEDIMKTKMSRSVCWVVVLGLFLFWGSPPAVPAAQPAGTNPDIIIKIKDLDKALDVMGGIIDTVRDAHGASPTAMLKGMLHGVEWIDFSRLIVVGIAWETPQPNMAALVPFKTPSDNFKSTWGATQGPDYYVISLPPGAAGDSKRLVSAMEKASRSESRATLDVEMTVGSLLEKAEESINQLLDQVENLPQKGGDPNVPLSPQEIRDMVARLLQTVAQLDSVSLRLNLSNVAFTSEMEMKATKGSELAALFTKETAQAFLNPYRPAHQVNFRMRSYRSEGLLKLIGDIFGKFYDKLGIDFNQIAQISQGFTGEMAGGMSFGKSGIDLEMVSVLRPEQIETDFIETVYLPWILDFGKRVANMMALETGQEIDPVFVQTPDSRALGYKIIGMESRFPMPEMSDQAPMPVNLKALTTYKVRMTTVDNMVLTTSNDVKMKALISKVKQLKKGQAKGPLMVVDYDMGAYINLLKEMVPGFLGQAPIPQLDRVVMTADASNGRAAMKSSVKMNDIRTFIAYFKGISTTEQEIKVGKQPAPGSSETVGGKSTQAAPPVPKKTETPEPVRTTWLEKGMLAALNGDNRKAIVQFEKAIETDSKNGDAYFHQGVSYGEVGEYAKAVSAITRAIELDPQNGAFYYGRGRVYLMSGEPEKAMMDFERAANLGNPDARRYLNARAQDQ